MKKYILIATLLFTGCSYKTNIYKNTFEKQKEISRDNCQKPIAKLKKNKIIIKEKCLITYKGIRNKKYNECEFSIIKYIRNTILGPFAGVGLLLVSSSSQNPNINTLLISLGLMIYPISAPFYRSNDCNSFFTSYKLNKINKTDKETLKFKDTVNIHPDKEIWIGNKNHQYPLKLNSDLSYYMPNRLINYFCTNKNNCNLTIFTRDDDKLEKLTTINIK